LKKRKRKLIGGRRIYALALSFCLSATALAQEPADTIAGRIHSLDDVTVTARRAPGRVSSASSVQVLRKEDIQGLGLQNMADAVKRLAGTQVRDYGGIGGMKTVSVRNLGAAHTAVVYDGVAVSNCQAGQIDIGRFSLDNIETLSLAVGQDDDLLQAARLYASAGVLSIQTERPDLSAPRPTKTQVQLRGGSFGYVTPSIRHWQKLGARTGLSADASYMRADGNYPFTLKNGKYVTREKRNNSDIYSLQGEVNLYHTFRDESQWDTKAYYYYSQRGLPGSVTLYNPISHERLWDENFFAQTRWRKGMKNKWGFQAEGKFNYTWNKYEDTNVKYQGGKQTDLNRQYEYYLSATASYRPSAHWEFALAQDEAFNALRTNVNECPNPLRVTTLTALNARYHSERLKVLGTLCGTYATEHVEAGTQPTDKHRLSPTLSASYRLLHDESLYLRAMYKHTFRLPTFNDLYYLQIGNTGLRPEKAIEYTVGLTWSTKPASWMDYLTLTVDGYINRVTDKIVAFPSTYVWKMANFGKVDISGLDVTFATSVPFARRCRASLTATYSYERAVDVTTPGSRTYRNQLPYTPRHHGNAGLMVEMPWVNVGYTVNMMSKRYYMSQNIPENEIDGYAEHTATLWREFPIRRTRFRLQAEVINLTDCQYDIIKYYPMPGRSVRATATLTF
jgi:outer membrane cobalamin receptor